MACPGGRPFRGNEQRGRIGGWSFQPQIVFENLDDFRRQRQNAFLVPFAEDSHLCLGQLEIFELKGQHLAGTQTIEQHQADQGEIAKGARAVPEPGDIFGRQRHHDATGLA